MKHTHFNLSIASSVLACAMAIGAVATATPAPAQEGSTILKATIPFDFQAGSRRMPAGQYEIGKLSQNVLLLRGTTKNSSEVLVVYAATTLTAPDHASMIFHRYGNHYFLSQIWSAGNTTGEQCSMSKPEKELTLAENYQPPTLVELALNTEPHR